MMEGEEFQGVYSLLDECFSLFRRCIGGISRQLCPGCFDAVEFKLVGRAREDSTDSEKLFVPYWGDVQ